MKKSTKIKNLISKRFKGNRMYSIYGNTYIDLNKDSLKIIKNKYKKSLEDIPKICESKNKSKIINIDLTFDKIVFEKIAKCKKINVSKKEINILTETMRDSVLIGFEDNFKQLESMCNEYYMNYNQRNIELYSPFRENTLLLIK